MNPNLRDAPLGGTLPPDAPDYVVRQADDNLYTSLRNGQFCYVLNSRQMGKSSLEVRVRQRLEADGVACALIDLTTIGVQEVTVDRWYASLIKSLADGFDLEFDLLSWWQAHERLTPLTQFGEFIETVLLAQVPQSIVIAIDEIDSVLSLEFPADDFFAFIRACYNQRNHKPDYRRLTFVLIGVATPSDLIDEKERTPFNLGQAIELQGFQPSEISPLAQKLAAQVESPQTVLEAILQWTGGQPFLTQKLCRLILKTEMAIAAGQETAAIEQLATTNIIANWESQDEPEHLRTIRNRLLKDKHQAGRLLGLYQQILHQGDIPADDSPDQAELCLSGLVVKQGGRLRVYNAVYQAVFNEHWVQDELAKLRPYGEAFTAWLESDGEDDSRLLRGLALRDALNWAADKTSLSEADNQFLQRSQAEADRVTRKISEQISRLAKTEAANILKQFTPQLEQAADRPSVVIQQIQAWAGTQPSLTEKICQLLVASPLIPENAEAEQVATLVQTQLIQDWQTQSAAEHLKTIQSTILEDERCVGLLQLYRQILQGEDAIADDSAELRSLLNLGLVENNAGQLRVANQIYARVFNTDWVEQFLAEVSRRRIIRRRYEVVKALKQGGPIQAYLVKDRDLYRQNQYVIKQLTPLSSNIDTLGKTQKLFNHRIKELETLNGHDAIPKLLASFEENQSFYLVQDFIEGHNLDEELTSEKRWNETSVIDLLIEVLEILRFVHQQNLIHLNLKPANLRRRETDGKIVLIDFGALKEINALATSTNQGSQTEAVGTPGYVPPQTIEENSKFSCDIYAVGMIGIQALTGTHPSDFSIDKKTGEIIWRFSIPGKPMVQVSDELAAILTKMVGHRLADRYTDVSSVIDDLQVLQTRPQAKRQHSWLSDRRVLAGGLIGLLFAGAVGYWGYRQFANARQLAEQVETCNLSNTLNQSANTSLVATAYQAQQACTWLIERQPDNVAAFKNRGQALLLSWKYDNSPNRVGEKGERLTAALADFRRAINIRPDDPQAFFFLGLAQALQRDESPKAAYEEAVNLYLNQNPGQMSEQDFPILVTLATFLTQGDRYSQSDYENANTIYQEARRLNAESMNLIYNHGSLNARAGAYREAIQIFNDMSKRNQQDNERIWISQGVTFLLIGEIGYPEALNAFEQALTIAPESPLAREYKADLESCMDLDTQPDVTQTPEPQAIAAQTPEAQPATRTESCELVNLTRDRLEPRLGDIFPILPVYECQDYPVLAIAEADSARPLCQ